MGNLLSSSLSHRVRLFMCGAALVLFTTAPAFSQDNPAADQTPDWGDYPLLMSQFGELCTMCVAYLHCSTENFDPEGTEATVLYYFETKDFWGQIQTIWDYYAQWFNPVTSESRPATVYTTAQARTVEAYLDKKNGTIEIDGTWIDRNTSAWFEVGSDEPLGRCDRPSIQAGLDMAAEITGIPADRKTLAP